MRSWAVQPPAPRGAGRLGSSGRWSPALTSGEGARRAYLSLAELQHLGQPLPLGRGEVLLGLELLLQLDGLVVGEPHLAAFPFMQRPLQERAPE